MNHITQVLPAGTWIAVRVVTGVRGEERRQEIPLVGWALVGRGGASASGQEIQQCVVGLWADGRQVSLVDESSQDFRGYEPAPLRTRQRDDLDHAHTQQEWDRAFTDSP